MANVKRRLNAPKSAPKPKKKWPDGRSKKGLRSLRAVIDIKTCDDSGSHDKDNGVVKKRAANDNLLILTPDEKVQYLLKNGRKLKDKFDAKASLQNGHIHNYNTKSKSGKIKKTKITKPTPDLPGLVKNDRGLLEGVTNKYKYLKIMDKLIMSEFGLPTTHKKSSRKNGTNNNNDSEITDQNNKTTDKNNKTTDKNSKTTDKNNKTNTKNNKSPVKNKKTISVDVQVPEKVAPALEQSKHSKQQTELVNFADEPKPQPLRRKGRPKKIPKYGKTPQTKQVALPNGVILTLPLYECDYCHKTFNRKHSLVRHIYLHLGWKPHSCPVCPKKFRILKNMEVHLDRDHCVQNVDESTETYSCNICDKPFLTPENLNSHLTSHVKGENSFKCIYCDKKFSYQLLLVQHEKKHLVTGKYQCTLCEVKYDSRDKLYVHVKSHLKLADYICQYCGREFLRANSLKRHIQTMHVGRTIQCPICNKNLKGHLTEHMRTHDKKRPHECPDCGKLFAQSTQMKVHRRGHTGFRPYLCRICERPFSHSNALMLHVRRHTGEKPFPCAECPMSFSQLPHMKAHMFKIHTKINPYKCFKCNDYFKLKKDLLIHKKTCNGTGIDIDLYGDERPFDDGLQDDAVAVKSTMTLSRMRFLLALLLTMIATKEKLKYLGFNKRLVDDLLVESLEAMDQIPCLDESLSPLLRLRTNIEKLLKGTVPPKQMEKFKKENKSTEELLELLTSEKDK